MPSLELNRKEQSLAVTQPEECLRRVVKRGALSLDELTEGLPPRVATVLRAVVTGGGRPLPEAESARDRARSAGGAGDDTELLLDMIVSHLKPYPRLRKMVREGEVEPGEALAAAQHIDRLFGRYPTGTRYAAP